MTTTGTNSNNLNLPLPQWLISALLLKPHGSNLLAPQAHLWIGFVRLIVGALALIEGLSWAYVGSFLGRNDVTTWLFALLLGAVIFVFVWGVDVSLMSLDVSEHRKVHRRQRASSDAEAGDSGDTGQVESMFANGWSLGGAWEFMKWPVFPVGIRSLLVVISVFVTAPFISMYVLHVEIEHELLNRFQSSYELVKKEKIKSSEAQMRERQQRETQAQFDVDARFNAWNQAQVAYTREVAGKGESRAYGDGAAARAAQTVVTANKLELELARKRLQELEKNHSQPTQADKELAELETAANNKKFDTLRTRFGILDVPDSFVARNKVMSESFEDKPEFQRVEKSVYALLGFLVIALFLLKYFEPKSVEIYFSEKRQSDWQSYIQGRYDDLLEDKDKAVKRASGMSPLYFCQLWDEVISVLSIDEEYKKAAERVQSLKKTYENDLNLLEEYKKELKRKIDDFHQKQTSHLSIQTTLDNRRVELHNLEEAKNSVLNKIMGDDRGDHDGVHGLDEDIAKVKSEISTASQNEQLARNSLEAVERQMSASQARYLGLKDKLTPILSLIENQKRAQRELVQAAISRLRSIK